MPAVTSVKIGKTPTYLFRKGKTYYFRIAIPVDVRQVIGKTEINYSLQTQDLQYACMKAIALAGFVRDLIANIRRGDFPMAEVTAEVVLEQEIELYIKWFSGLERGRPMHGRPFTDEELKERIQEIQDMVNGIRKDLAIYDHSRFSSSVEKALSKLGVEEPKKHQDFDKFCREIQIQYLKLNEIYLEHAMGDYSRDYPWDKETEERVNASGGISFKLSDFLTFYVEEASRNWNPKTKLENMAMIQNFIDIVGDCSLHMLTREKVRDYKAKLLKFPKNVTKNPNFRDKTIQEIVQMEVPEEERISAETIKNRFTKVKSFLIWMRRQGYPVEQAFEDILTISIPTRPDQHRAIFTPEDLKLLFNSSDYLEDKLNQPYRFWVPLIGLFTGARLEEICQLELEDIKEVDGIWCMDINSKGAKSVKTAAGERLVPLHPFLVEDLKLINYVDLLKETRNERLFPELKRTEKYGYGHEVSRWFSSYKKKVGVQDSPYGKKVFHSFRHTFLDNCKKRDVDKLKAMECVGHENGDNDITYGRYGKKYEPDILYNDVILKVQFDVDLGHLKKSKFVIGK